MSDQPFDGAYSTTPAADFAPDTAIDETVQAPAVIDSDEPAVDADGEDPLHAEDSDAVDPDAVDPDAELESDGDAESELDAEDDGILGAAPDGQAEPSGQAVPAGQGASDEPVASDVQSDDGPGSAVDLDRIAQLPLSDQPAEYEQIHNGLRRSLAEIDEA